MKKVRKNLAKVCAFLLMINTIPVNVYAEESPSSDDENNVIVEEESTTEEQAADTEESNAALPEATGIESTKANVVYSANDKVYSGIYPVIVAVNSSVTRDNMITDFYNEKHYSIYVDPEEIESFGIDSDPDGILALSEDNQEIYANSPGTAQAFAMKSNGTIKMNFTVIVTDGVYEFEAPKDIYIPYVGTGFEADEPEIDETDINALKSSGSVQSIPYINSGATFIDINCVPAKANYDISIIDANGKTVEDPLDNNCFLIDRLTEDFTQDVVVAMGRGNRPCDAGLKFQYYDTDGNSQEANSTVHIVKDLPYSDFGNDNAPYLLVVYRTADGYLQYADTSEHKINMNVGDAIDVMVLQRTAVTLTQSNGQKLYFPKYELIAGYSDELMANSGDMSFNYAMFMKCVDVTDLHQS